MGLRNIKIRTKLLGGFLIMATLITMASVVGSIYNRSTVKLASAIVKDEVPVVNASKEMQLALISGCNIIEDYIRIADIVELDKTKEKYERAVENFSRYAKGILEGIEEDGFRIKKTSNEAIRVYINKVNDYYARFKENVSEMIKYHNLTLQRDPAASLKAIDSLKNLKENTRQAEMLLYKVAEEAERDMVSAVKNAETSRTLANRIVMGITLVGFITAVVIGLVFTRGITKPLAEAVNVSNQLARGDLNTNIKVIGRDEPAQLLTAMNNMVVKLNENEQLKQEINERKKAEEALQSVNQKLLETNKALESKTRELEDAYKKMSELEQVKTNFISTVTHELRTPLTSILGFADNTLWLYKKNIIPVLPTDKKKFDKWTKTIEENLSIVVSEGKRLTDLINDVLDIAKIEAGTIEWNIEKVDIIDICRHALTVVSGYPKSSKVEIIFEAPDSVEFVKGDHDRLVQVITNFMSNALKFTEEGSVTLKVEPAVKHVKISTIDTGKGIDKDDIKEVFDKFKQLSDDTLTNKPRGTGLGLPICKEIIERFGGTVWAESEAGKGSCFCFTLNYYSAEKGKRTKPVFRIRKKIVEEVIQKIDVKDMERKPNVLIVDDDLNIRKLLRKELEEAGYNIMEADNGTQALTTVKNKDNHIDLILLDIMMPNVDGFDVLSAVKTNEKLAHIPIIVISAYEVEKKVYRLGADCFLHKPIDRIQLINKMSFLLKNGGSKQKVLIIDSNDNIIADIKSYLEEKGGYTVNSASNYKDGLEKARNEKPDVIMFDLAMPDIKNGLEMLRKLRLDEENTGHVHLILLADRMNDEALRIAESLDIQINEPKKITKS
jgi:signal transduction histidine kinase/DNA-binding response OmpR family regulator